MQIFDKIKLRGGEVVYFISTEGISNLDEGA